MTKTIIDVDDELLEQTIHFTGATKKAAVNEALAQVVRRGEALGYIDMLRSGVAIELDDADVIADAQR